ncbi:MAG: SDR family NAD(P)-dependent oxidoreductase [Rickettsiales bacterium]|nr:SDR family NAD(P)-dependent oxidoreductase [Rickettsiales bacterium]
MKNPSNIIITGASSGIGKALAIKYSQNCHNLLIVGRNEDRLNLARNLCNLKCNVQISATDVTNFQKIKNTIYQFDKQYPIDLIIANAGISAGSGNAGENIDQLKKIYDTNIYGVINCIYPAIEKMTKRQSGQIAIMSSMSAFTPIPTAPAYSSSKQCVSFIGHALRHSLVKHNIKLSVIYPGFVETPMTDKNKFIMPFIMKPEIAVDKIITGLQKNKAKIIFPKIFYLMTLALNIMPDKIQRYMFNKAPAKDSL